MDDLLKYLVKKSDIENNEFFNYRQREDMEKLVRKREPKPQKENCAYVKLTEPEAEDYVVLDFETTGMTAGINKIIEIGAVKAEKGVVTDVFSTLVDPEQIIPGFIRTKVHITDSMVKGQPKIEEVLPKFMAFLGNLPIVAHNAPFDMSFLIRNAKQLDICYAQNRLFTIVEWEIAKDKGFNYNGGL